MSIEKTDSFGKTLSGKPTTKSIQIMQDKTIQTINKPKDVDAERHPEEQNIEPKAGVQNNKKSE